MTQKFRRKFLVYRRELREILTTSAFVFTAGAVTSAVASLVLVDAGAVGALIFRTSFGFGRLSWAVGFVAVVDAIDISVANPLRLNAFALTEVLVVVALN